MSVHIFRSVPIPAHRLSLLFPVGTNIAQLTYQNSNRIIIPPMELLLSGKYFMAYVRAVATITLHILRNRDV